MKPGPIRNIIAGAAIGALVASATSLVMVFQPGIVDDEAVQTRDILVINFGIGMPICIAAGALLGWLWHRWFSRS